MTPPRGPKRGRARGPRPPSDIIHLPFMIWFIPSDIIHLPLIIWFIAIYPKSSGPFGPTYLPLNTQLPLIIWVVQTGDSRSVLAQRPRRGRFYLVGPPAL